MTIAESFDVLGCGVLSVDDLLYVDEYPPAERKVKVRHRIRQCGGLTGTALVAAARLGAKCAYVGVLGNDELSHLVADCFEREGIGLTHHVHRDDAQPAHCTIIVDAARKTRTIFASVDGAVGADLRRPEPELIRSASVLLIDHHSLEGTLRAVRIARAGGVAVVADFERCGGPQFAELLDLVDHLIVSRQFARELTGSNDPPAAVERLWTRGRKAGVVTCGQSGCWYMARATAEQPQHCPAFEVEVIDTTGCGDVFHGAYAAGLAGGLDVHARVMLASATAALKATQRGGQAGIPNRQSVEAFLAQRDRRL